MRVQKFVTRALRSVKNMLNMEWRIANDALKHAGSVPKSVVLWLE